ncbi:MAG: UDP-2,3-diacylglucosamine diphosphatase [Planctomycetes bacterium]|nr:UDP-2,3-diacylglucosamine diphosphatase [Planctomycetota bacterium]
MLPSTGYPVITFMPVINLSRNTPMNLLISDLHLAIDGRNATDFIYLLKNMPPNVENLFVLGDLFDIWISDHHYKKCFVIELIDTLKRVTSNGTNICFTRGNRDFLVGNSFQLRTGVQVENDVFDREMSGLKVRLTHGDLLCTRDTRYQAFRRIVRSGFVSDLARSMPEKVAAKIAGNVREVTVRDLQKKNYSNLRATKTGLLRHAGDADVIVYGHLHEQSCHEGFANGKYRRIFCLEPFCDRGYILVENEGQFSYTFAKSITGLE